MVNIGAMAANHGDKPDSSGSLLREASVKDGTEVLALIREYYAFDEIPFDSDEIQEGLSCLLSSAQFGRVYFVLSDQQTVGYVILTFGFDLEFGGRLGIVTDLYLKPLFRRKGLGLRAFQALEGQAESLGLSALLLQPERDNIEARAFYMKLGFREQDRSAFSKRLGLSPEGRD